MKKVIFVLSNGEGWFAENEEELCKQYCKENNCTYTKKIIRF